MKIIKINKENKIIKIIYKKYIIMKYAILALLGQISAVEIKNHNKNPHYFITADEFSSKGEEDGK